MSTGRVTGIVSGVLALAALAAAWTFFAPTQMGGGTSYAILVGNSMEPGLHRGDLAVVRRLSSYRAGDVVLYDSRELGTKVLHRIVRVDGGRFVLKGDNNTFSTRSGPPRSRSSARSGSVPGVGRATGYPAAAAQRAPRRSRHPARPRGGLGAGAAVRRDPQPRRRPRAVAPPRPARVPEELKPCWPGSRPRRSPASRLAVVSFQRPLTGTEPGRAAYAHQGRFDYQACVTRNAAYPDGSVTTGAGLPPPRPAPAGVVRLPARVAAGGRLGRPDRPRRAAQRRRGWER